MSKKDELATMSHARRLARLKCMHKVMYEELDALPYSPDKFKALHALDMSFEFAMNALELHRLDQERQKRESEAAS